MSPGPAHDGVGMGAETPVQLRPRQARLLLEPHQPLREVCGEVIGLSGVVYALSRHRAGPSGTQPEASLQGERRHRLSCRPQTLGVPVASWYACLIRPSICAGFSCCPLLARPGDDQGAGRAEDVVSSAGTPRPLARSRPPLLWRHVGHAQRVAPYLVPVARHPRVVRPALRCRERHPAVPAAVEVVVVAVRLVLSLVVVDRPEKGVRKRPAPRPGCPSGRTGRSGPLRTRPRTAPDRQGSRWRRWPKLHAGVSLLGVNCSSQPFFVI